LLLLKPNASRIWSCWLVPAIYCLLWVLRKSSQFSPLLPFLHFLDQSRLAAA
jgi:hypothetical protein